MSEPLDIRNRIVEHRKMRLGDIADNPNNWRLHPKMQQDALNGLVKQIGWVGTPIVYHSARTGKWTYVDGHLRKHEYPNLEVEVAVTDLNDSEADLVIGTYDPIGDLATADREIYAVLMRDMHTTDAGLSQMIANLAEAQGLIPKDNEFDPNSEWQGMPEFDHEDKTAFQSIHVHFKDQKDIDKFSELVGQKITPQTRSIWYPFIEIERYANKRYESES